MASAKPRHYVPCQRVPPAGHQLWSLFLILLIIQITICSFLIIPTYCRMHSFIFCKLSKSSFTSFKKEKTPPIWRQHACIFCLSAKCQMQEINLPSSLSCTRFKSEKPYSRIDIVKKKVQYVQELHPCRLPSVHQPVHRRIESCWVTAETSSCLS